MFLITGCGRSGTLYAACVLAAAGLDVGHECAGRDGAVSGLWAVADSVYPSFHEQGQRPEFDVVLHQVREPLACIGSLTTSNPESWAWNARHIELENGWPIMRGAAEYWLQWNRIAEAQAAMTYRVEAMHEVWPKICALLQIDAPFPEDIPTRVNRRKHRSVTWDDIREATPHSEEIIQMAQSYGYGG